MGKRKKAAKKPQGPKKKEKLPTTFQCLFCNHENSVTVKIEKKLGVGSLQCKVCGQNFSTGTNYLSAPVDVYADWIDACDAVAADAAGGTAARSSYRDVDHHHAASSRAHAGAAPSSAHPNDSYHNEEGGDDFVVDDDPDAEGEYADEE